VLGSQSWEVEFKSYPWQAGLTTVGILIWTLVMTSYCCDYDSGEVFTLIPAQTTLTMKHRYWIRLRFSMLTSEKQASYPAASTWQVKMRKKTAVTKWVSTHLEIWPGRKCMNLLLYMMILTEWVITVHWIGYSDLGKLTSSIPYPLI